MRRSIDELMKELYNIVDQLGGGSVKYDGIGYTVILDNPKHYGQYYCDTFTGIKKMLQKLQ